MEVLSARGKGGGGQPLLGVCMLGWGDYVRVGICELEEKNLKKREDERGAPEGAGDRQGWKSGHFVIPNQKGVM